MPKAVGEAKNRTKAVKYTENDRRFEPSSIPIQSPWRSYSRFNKYDERFTVTVYELGIQGKSKAQIASSLNCSIGTFNRWIEEIEEMHESWEMAQTKSESYWDTKIEEVLIADDLETGLPATNTKLLEKMLSSRFKKYKEGAGSTSEQETSKSSEVDGVMSKLMESFDKLKITASVGDKEMNLNVSSKTEEPKLVNPSQGDDNG